MFRMLSTIRKWASELFLHIYTRVCVKQKLRHPLQQKPRVARAVVTQKPNTPRNKKIRKKKTLYLILMLNITHVFILVLLQNELGRTSSFSHPKSIVLSKFCYVQSKTSTFSTRSYHLQQMGSDDFLPETNIDNGINESSSSMKDDEQTSSKHQNSFGSNELEAPTTSEIIKFAIPATGIWLCGPLLSLIDTSVVGYFSGTIQQAALNPAIAITDYGGLLVVRKDGILYIHLFLSMLSNE